MTSFQWEGVSLADVLTTTGAPALIASERRLRQNVRDLRRGFESVWPSTILRYCAKTNPELQVLRIVREEATHVLTSHAAEVRLALAAGFRPEQIAYQRPIPDHAELDEVIGAGIRRFHAFRLTDLDELSRAAVARECELRISLRVSLGRSGMFALSGASRRLGFSAEALSQLGAKREGLVIDALNTYIGTQQEQSSAYRPAMRGLARLAVALRAAGHPIEELNLGGGIPSNSIRRLTAGRLLTRGRSGMIEARSPEAYAASLGRIAAGEIRAADPAFAPRLVLEPGRSIVGNTMVLLTRIRAEQDRWRFLDCGRNVLVESPLAFTRWIAPLDASRRGSARVHLSGPTLNTLDVVDVHRTIPEVHRGDVLVIGDAGAYTIARSTRYAGLTPALWMARLDGSLICIRREETYDDLIAPMLGESG